MTTSVAIPLYPLRVSACPFSFFFRLVPTSVPFPSALSGRPAVVLLCGLQGSGKTTTAGKLAKLLRGKGRHPLLAAADLQRAVFNLPGVTSSQPVARVSQAIDEALDVFTGFLYITALAGRVVFSDGLLEERNDEGEILGQERVMGTIGAQAGTGLDASLDTLVGERGVTLSGGQKQRATLARGFIRNASVLVLDDCFSAVDTETEEHILSELKRLRSWEPVRRLPL